MIPYQKLHALVRGLPLDRLDDVARLAWRGYAEGRLTDGQAQAIALAIEQRRGRAPWQRAKADSIAPPPRKRLPFIR
jgi:hypothetical protein